MFVNGVWYCLHDNEKLSGFETAESWEWRKMSLLDYPEHSVFSILVSIVMKFQGHMHLCIDSLNKSYEVVLDEILDTLQPYRKPTTQESQD